MQVKRSLATINRPAYQIVRIRPGLMTDGEREKSKIIDTTEQIVC